MLKKIIILGLTALFMTACGPNDSDGASSSRGSGECVDISPEDGVGLTGRFKITSHHGGKIIHSKIESQEIESFTKTYNKVITYDDNENMIRTRESEYFISNGLLKLTKVTIDYVSGPDSEYTFDPYNASVKIGKNCKGDTWETEYTPYITTDGHKKQLEKIHSKYIIEDVNVEKTVTAGTFNTVKVRTENFDKPSDYSYYWLDTSTGLNILNEHYMGGELVIKAETLDIY